MSKDLNSDFSERVKEPAPQFYFHVTKDARKKYTINDTLFSIKGRIIFTNYNSVRLLANSINQNRDIVKNPEMAVSPSLINAVGLMDEILHYLIETYRTSVSPALLNEMLKKIQHAYGASSVNQLLKRFLDEFPNNEIYHGKISAQEYLKNETEGFKNTDIVIEELFVQWIQNQNKAYVAVKELIDDQSLKNTIYEDALEQFSVFLKNQPKVPGTELSLIEMLLLPAKLFPNDVFKQLEYIKDNWGEQIGIFLSRILIGLDFFKEEAKKFNPGMFSNPETFVPEFGGDIYEFEPEAFSADLDWMPHLVLIAKSTYVWLDQLSKQYKREITTLDQIPDEELNRLASFGFTGLWLIGLWERSTASKKIKQINGNPEAVASAYSLKNYEIANDIGGYSAYQNLKDRAWKRGIRLASDMVPNHMAIDSDWVKLHPHWFIHSEHPPFPNHSFNGPNLSDDPGLGIYIEDGYWSKSDAAVAFKRVDHGSGHTMYIYHGNDGTGMPWNDTAQLNYLIPEVREAVIQTILHVARHFPIIRFDAAMTLAKKHYQRLWFPEPGGGGDIPTRSGYAQTKAQFNEVFPTEFWRDVVDRIQVECPDTLLLAEAFWMMEGFFVRTLGMHRVYNSAFMNMLKKEENDKYRLMIKNILEFNPQILKRYVNFMNNPDEETAIAQFGKDDKYFGVCMLMCTMPGLPMFGHGQIEGFNEKYGMEYKKAYWDEHPDDYLVDRHRREIFPLLKKRKLFSEVDHFYLFNFFTGAGHVDENVFCYTNSYNTEHSMVLYNNVFNDTKGWIKESSAYNDGSENLKTINLAEALNLSYDARAYCILHEHISGREFIRSSMDIHHNGLYVELGAFKYQVFTSIYEVWDDSQNHYAELSNSLNGQSVESIHESLHELKLMPVLKAFRTYFTSDFEKLVQRMTSTKTSKKELILLVEMVQKIKKEIELFYNIPALESKLSGLTKLQQSLLNFKKLVAHSELSKQSKTKINTINKDISENSIFVFYAHTIRTLIELLNEPNTQFIYDHWRINKILLQNQSIAAKKLDLLKLLSCFPKLILLIADNKNKKGVSSIFDNPELKLFLMVNSYNNIIYFNKERWEELVDAILIYVLVSDLKFTSTHIKQVNKSISRYKSLLKIAEKVGYDFAKLTKTLLN